jgi:hypothetical protein
MKDASENRPPTISPLKSSPTFRNEVDHSKIPGDDSEMADKNGRGGARAGAGRKRIVQEPERIGIDFERTDSEALRALARKRDTSVANLVRTAVAQYLRRSGVR